MKKILVIEDDRDVRNTYKTVFEQAGYTFFESENGKEGLRLAKQETPNIIILDIMLPSGMNGFDVLESLKRDPLLSAIPVIMLTNLDSEAKVAHDIGASDYMVKADVSVNDLLAKVQSIIK